ncbi:purine-nucleoside phosphorylase [Luteolibacter flavescens]|uniref:purine-nucleoside phosphorylase n=1 Tax=Luteolibacter flavescens TaxID=1859460 RepID=A0ABT3FS23_9BACT|nr:purine-nucleoside phosphorylase [Luteolibacter flavescens]MCW1886252.1 purine-nucleoside phosphorylase [Luteolibacter flavescens]
MADPLALGIVLGSGLGPLADRVVVRDTISFADAGLPSSSVQGHAGRFLIGSLGSREVIVMQGRIHLYEGHGAKAVTAGIRWMHDRGVRHVILTNAAGTLNESHAPGTWMMLADHLNLTGTSPLEGGPHFIDMTRVYDEAAAGEFQAVASRLGITLHQGVYAGLRGPQYETPAEIRMLRTLGADAVGMSTVLEAIQARALGMKVTAFSCLTNWAAGMSPELLDHSDVLATGKAAADEMLRLLEEWCGS